MRKGHLLLGNRLTPSGQLPKGTHNRSNTALLYRAIRACHAKKLDILQPFSALVLSDDLGYIIKWEYQCPGVFYVANEGEGRIAGEYYIVEQNSLYISAAAKT